jgi:hypothetical protein
VHTHATSAVAVIGAHLQRKPKCQTPAATNTETKKKLIHVIGLKLRRGRRNGKTNRDADGGRYLYKRNSTKILAQKYEHKITSTKLLVQKC